jgi:hypothetical protein
VSVPGFPLLVVKETERPSVPPELLPPDSRTVALRVALMGVAVLLLAVALVALGFGPSRNARKKNKPTQARTLLPPVIDAIRPVSSGGISFRWSDPNDGVGYVPAFQVFEDGTLLTGTTEMKRNASGVPLTEQFVDAVTFRGKRHPIDPTAHVYCVVVRLVNGPDPAESAEACTKG